MMTAAEDWRPTPGELDELDGRLNGQARDRLDEDLRTKRYVGAASVQRVLDDLDTERRVGDDRRYREGGHNMYRSIVSELDRAHLLVRNAKDFDPDGDDDEVIKELVVLVQSKMVVARDKAYQEGRDDIYTRVSDVFEDVLDLLKSIESTPEVVELRRRVIVVQKLATAGDD